MNIMDLGLPQIPKMEVPKLRNNDVEVVLKLEYQGVPEKIYINMPCGQLEAMFKVNCIVYHGDEYEIILSKYDITDGSYMLILGGI